MSMQSLPYSFIISKQNSAYRIEKLMLSKSRKGYLSIFLSKFLEFRTFLYLSIVTGAHRKGTQILINPYWKEDIHFDME